MGTSASHVARSLSQKLSAQVHGVPKDATGTSACTRRHFPHASHDTQSDTDTGSTGSGAGPAAPPLLLLPRWRFFATAASTGACLRLRARARACSRRACARKASSRSCCS